jgi:hypothetical protein
VPTLAGLDGDCEYFGESELGDYGYISYEDMVATLADVYDFSKLGIEFSVPTRRASD